VTVSTDRKSSTTPAEAVAEAFNRSCPTGEDESDARIKLARMPLNLCHRSAGFFQLCAL
jgi:hypothetical protein